MQHTLKWAAVVLVVVGCGKSDDSSGNPSGAAGAAGAAQSDGGAAGANAGGNSGNGGIGGNGGNGGIGGGARDLTPCDPFADCAAGEHCVCGGGCAARPSSCDGECVQVCGCSHDVYCNACLAHMLGSGDRPASMCGSDGGAPGYGSLEAGAPCAHSVFCQDDLKCCYQCEDAGDCRGICASVGDAGSCPRIEPE